MKDVEERRDIDIGGQVSSCCLSKAIESHVRKSMQTFKNWDGASGSNLSVCGSIGRNFHHRHIRRFATGLTASEKDDRENRR